MVKQEHKRNREDATYEERINIINKVDIKKNNYLIYNKTSKRHRGYIPSKIPNGHTRNKPLYKVYHNIPIRLTEYKYLLNYFKYKGLSFDYPIEKIKFV